MMILKGTVCIYVLCSDIIHYANRKLKVYKGNLSAFVAAVPEAQSYYALEATEQVCHTLAYDLLCTDRQTGRQPTLVLQLVAS
jgi:elongation factor 3